MQKYSQRDSRWASIRLGTGSGNTTTISSHGCTVTAIGMVVEKTPEEVNSLFIKHGSFSSLKESPDVINLVNWQRIDEAITSLEFEWRGYSYEDDKVKAAIGKNGFCLVEINAAPIGGTKHWVLAIGGGKIYDPFDGKEKAFSTYSPTGYCVINKKEVSMPGTLPSNFDDIVHGSTQWDKTVTEYLPDTKPSEASFEALQRYVGGIKSTATSAQNTLTEVQKKLATTQSELDNRIEQVSRLKEEATQLEKTWNDRYTALKSSTRSGEAVEASYRGQLGVMQRRVDEAMKEKGAALNTAAEAKAELKACQDNREKQVIGLVKWLIDNLPKIISGLKGLSKASKP